MKYEITRLNIENEMDLVVAHKRSIRLGDSLNLSISNQTTFTTAISECCREVIEKAGAGILIIQVAKEDDRYCLQAIVRYKDPGNNLSGRSTLDYAKKLVNQLRVYADDTLTNIELKINIPRSARLSDARIREIIDFFRKDYPDTPYEQVEQRKEEYSRLASGQEE